jgi:hypothetical protein
VPRDRVEVGNPVGVRRRLRPHVRGSGRVGRRRRGPGPARIDGSATPRAVPCGRHRRRRQEAITGGAPGHVTISAGLPRTNSAHEPFTIPWPTLAVGRSRSSPAPADTASTARGNRAC